MKKRKRSAKRHFTRYLLTVAGTVILVIAGIILIGSGGVLYRSATGKPMAQSTTIFLPFISDENRDLATPIPDETGNDVIGSEWQTYTDKNTNYTIKYPPAWTMEEISPEFSSWTAYSSLMVFYSPDFTDKTTQLQKGSKFTIKTGDTSVFKNEFILNSVDASSITGDTSTGPNVLSEEAVEISNMSGVRRIYKGIPGLGSNTVTIDIVIAIDDEAFNLTCDMLEQNYLDADNECNLIINSFSVTP